MQTTAGIEPVLSGALREQYRAQRAALAAPLAARPPEEAVAALRAHLQGVFTTALGLDADDSLSLARLATEAHGLHVPPPTLETVIDRAALVRACIQMGAGASLQPYLRAVAAGARAGHALDVGLVVSGPLEAVEFATPASGVADGLGGPRVAPEARGVSSALALAPPPRDATEARQRGAWDAPPDLGLDPFYRPER